MRLQQAVSYTHVLTEGRGSKPLSEEKASSIDAHLAGVGLSLALVFGEGRVDLSGLPMKVGDEILEQIRVLFDVHIAYNRHAYDAQKSG